MPEKHLTELNEFADVGDGVQGPVIDSSFRLIVVAALRSKQLVRGSRARIEPNPLRRRNTSIALEEVRRGLVHFSIRPKTQKGNSSTPLDQAVDNNDQNRFNRIRPDLR